MADATLPTRQALTAAVKAAVSPIPVYDVEAPQAQSAPYVVMAGSASDPWDTKTTEGQELTFDIEVITRSTGATADQKIIGTKSTDQTLNAIRTALHRKPFAVVGHTVVEVLEDHRETDPEGGPQRPPTVRGMARYRVWTEAAA